MNQMNESNNQSNPSPVALWALTLILGEDYWQIRVPAGRFAKKAEAEAAANDAAVTFECPKQPMVAFTYHGSTGYAFDKQDADDEGCLITEISAEKRQMMGRPLDTRDPQDREKAVQALMTQDSAYCIGPDDMVPSAKTLADFLATYGAGYKPDIIAYGIHPVGFAYSVCIGCGCHDMHACTNTNTGNACSWARLDRNLKLGVCSECVDFVARWDNGDRAFSAFAESELALYEELPSGSHPPIALTRPWA